MAARVVVFPEPVAPDEDEAVAFHHKILEHLGTFSPSMLGTSVLMRRRTRDASPLAEGIPLKRPMPRKERKINLAVCFQLFGFLIGKQFANNLFRDAWLQRLTHLCESVGCFHGDARTSVENTSAALF